MATIPFDNAPAKPRTKIGELLNVDSGLLLRRLSLLMLALWFVWWGISLSRSELIGFKRSWCPHPCFGCDFINALDGPTRVWQAGKDPYAEKGAMFFIYPPLVLRVFAWCSLFSSKTAWVIWMITLASVAAAGAVSSWRTRIALGLRQIPLSTVLVAVLFSWPVIFAMERGNCDMLSLLFVLIGVYLMRRNDAWSDYAAGAVMALAPWVKVYPGLLGIGLVGLRKWKALAGFVVMGAFIGILHFEEFRLFARNSAEYQTSHFGMGSPAESFVSPWSHSLSQSWKGMWLNTPFRFLSKVDGKLAAFLILAPLLVWVTRHVYKSPHRDRLAYAYLIWILALASFVPPLRNDFALVFLPLAVLAVCDIRDPLLVRLALILLVVWWQPFGLPINGRVLLAIKLAGVAAVGVCLAERAAGAIGQMDKRKPSPEPEPAVTGL